MVSHNIAPMFEVRNVDTAASTTVIEQKYLTLKCFSPRLGSRPKLDELRLL